MEDAAAQLFVTAEGAPKEAPLLPLPAPNRTNPEAAAVREACAAASQPDFPPVELPLVIKRRWKFKTRIGQGSFGAVFSGRDLQTGERLACKLEPVSHRRSLLKTEVLLLKELQGRNLVTGRPPWYRLAYVARIVFITQGASTSAVTLRLEAREVTTCSSFPQSLLYVIILSKFQFAACVSVPIGFNYLIMELLADNLAQNFRLSRQARVEEAELPASKGTLATDSEHPEPRYTALALTFTQCAFFGRQLISAVESLHDHGTMLVAFV